MKLITLTATSITSIKCKGRFFGARVYRCSEQCKNVTGGHSFFTGVTNPDLTPIIDGVTSVQMCLKFCLLSSLASKKNLTRALRSAAVVVADYVSLNKNSFFIFLVYGEGDQVDFFFAPYPINISIIFSAHGFISSSAIVCNVLLFPIRYATS